MQIGERQYRTLVKELITNNLIHKIMRTTINHNGKEIKLSATLVGVTCKWDNYRYFFVISISFDDRKKYFTFYDSVEKYEKGINTLSEDALIGAFCCILKDANYVCKYDLREFCSSLCYDKEEGERIYNKCLKSLDKLNEIGLSENDITELLNSKQLEPYM